MSIFAELKRRNVYRAAVLYAASAWLLVQVVTAVVPYFHIPEWVVRWIIVASVIGLPFWLAFAWFYEFTPEGLKRESEIDPSDSIAHRTGRTLDFIIIGVMAVAIVLLLTDRFVPRRGVNQRAAAAIPEQSIAVLPFVDMSQAKDQEYFSDGLSEELLNLLSKVPQLRVIARTSSFSFKGKDADVATIAGTLKVANVLEGSVRKSGNTLRITAQLVRTTDSTQLWSETYDREMTDIFKVQDEIAAAVVAAMKLKLLGARVGAGAGHETANVEAYNQYLLGRQLYNRMNEDSWRQSKAALERAVALDPGYAAAWAALSDTLTPLSDFLDTPEEITQAKIEAVEAADKAIALAPDLADGYAARAYLRAAASWDFRGSEADLDKALALDPASTTALRRRGELMATIGRVPEAVAAMRELIASDPLNDQYWTNLCGYLLGTDLKAAREAGARAVALNPTSTFALVNMGFVELLDGKPEAARSMFDRVGEFWVGYGRALVEHRLGNKEVAQAALDEVIRNGAYGGAYQIAQLHAWRGEPTQALEWLERAIAQRDAGIAYLKWDQVFNALRADPRYAALLEKLGLPP